MTSDKAIEIIASTTSELDLFVCSLGRTAEVAFRSIENIDRVLFVDCLGATMGLGIGIALANQSTSVFAFDTDGSFFYNITILNAIRNCRKQLLNFHPIIFDNEKLESAGGAPSASVAFNWTSLAQAWGLDLVVVSNEDDLRGFLNNRLETDMQPILVIKVDNSDLENCCTKDVDGIESKYRFKRFINTYLRRGIIKPCIKN